MLYGSFEILAKKIIIRVKDRICDNEQELLGSRLFKEVVRRCVRHLEKKDSVLIGLFGDLEISNKNIDLLAKTIQMLELHPFPVVTRIVEEAEIFSRNPELCNDFIEYLYNYWRSFDRFILCSSTGTDNLDKRPYRTFNATIERLTHLVRGAYRNIQENITGRHPAVYRQVHAGAEVATICLPVEVPYPSRAFTDLKEIPIIRQVLMYPPLILEPPMNKRSGEFVKAEKNPLEGIHIDPNEWLCYPAKVGPLLMMIFFHYEFFELGFSLCNLFELADIEELDRPPDAVYMYGVPGDEIEKNCGSPIVFYDDEERNMLVAAAPNKPEFGYFGYLKKMVLTLHNITMMKRGNLPFHGALVKVAFRKGKEATLLIIGDTGAGKSETLEALRIIGSESIRELNIIADDMGSLEIEESGGLMGRGTEIGAFLRLDDLQSGYAFGQLDRAIIMSPSKVNARIVMPINTYTNVLRGAKIDYLLYANNYDEIDADHSIVQRFDDPDTALSVFKEGTVMSKGTTASTGIVHSYFANIFGPPQYRELHDHLAKKFFHTFFKSGGFVGQIRTRLGIPGHETSGPEEAAKELLSLI